MGIPRSEVIVPQIIRYDHQNVLGLATLHEARKQGKQDNGV